jgi:hypothetical protein
MDVELPSRPTKAADSRAQNFGNISIELGRGSRPELLEAAS